VIFIFKLLSDVLINFIFQLGNRILRGPLIQRLINFLIIPKHTKCMLSIENNEIISMSGISDIHDIVVEM